VKWKIEGNLNICVIAWPECPFQHSTDSSRFCAVHLHRQCVRLTAWVTRRDLPCYFADLELPNDCVRIILKLFAGTHRLSSHVVVLQASLENAFHHNNLSAYSTWSGFGYLGHFEKITDCLIDWLTLTSTYAAWGLSIPTRPFPCFRKCATHPETTSAGLSALLDLKQKAVTRGEVTELFRGDVIPWHRHTNRDRKKYNENISWTPKGPGVSGVSITTCCGQLTVNRQ